MVYYAAFIDWKNIFSIETTFEAVGSVNATLVLT